jgi:hypothetical protein
MPKAEVNALSIIKAAIGFRDAKSTAEPPRTGRP